MKLIGAPCSVTKLDYFQGEQKSDAYQKITILFLSCFCVCQTVVAGNWSTGSAKPVQMETAIPIEGLMGVGINSMALWSGASKIKKREQLVSHLAPLAAHGFSHVVLVSCADWIIGLRCKKDVDIDLIVKAVKAVIEGTNLHVVLSLKAYDQRKISGKNTSKLQISLEEDEATQTAFVETWASLAKNFKEIDRERLSFNLLNEPEFELPKPTSIKRDKWLAIASNAIEAIRNVSPDRVIIIEGIGKSLFANRYKSDYEYSSVTKLIKPVLYPDVIYGFHNYEPEEFLQQAKYRSGVVGRPHTDAITKAVKKDAARLIQWANKNKVPVILSETGCIGYLDDYWLDLRLKQTDVPGGHLLKDHTSQTHKTTVMLGSTLSHACDVYKRTKGKGRGKLFFSHTDRAVGYAIQCLGNKYLCEYTTIDAGEFRDWLFGKGLKRS